MFNLFKRRKKIKDEGSLREIIARGEEEGIITEEEEELITSIFEIGDTPVEEVMVPRVDIVAIDSNSSIDEIIKLFCENGHGKLPVFHGTIDNIVGLIYVKELLKLWNTEGKILSVDVMKLPYFIPYTKKVLETIREFQKLHISVAIVVDEYGGVEGMVTMEDLIEEIVGELQDELDKEKLPIKKVANNAYMMRGVAELETIEDLFGVSFGEEDVRTIGGLILKKLGRIPKTGEKVRIDGFEITILESSRQRIHRVILRKK